MPNSCLQRVEVAHYSLFYNLLYNKFTTNGQKFAAYQHLDMSRCWLMAKLFVLQRPVKTMIS